MQRRADLALFAGLVALAACSGKATEPKQQVGGQNVAVDILPGSADVLPSGAVQFAATVTGAANPAVVWSIDEGSGGLIDGTGLYTAPDAPGTFHVRATSLADAGAHGIATVTVTFAPTIGVAVVPQAPEVIAGSTTTFSAIVTGTADQRVTWRVEEPTGCGTISVAGTYSAPVSAATCRVVATSVADATKSALATVTVVPPPPGAVSRPTYNTGTGFFVRDGRVYDPNGQQFLARGANRAHVPDYGAGWTGMQRTRFNAVRHHTFLWYQQGCAGFTEPTSWPTDAMQDAIAHGQVVIPSVFSLECWFGGTYVTGGPNIGRTADGYWPEMERAVDQFAARASTFKSMEPYVWIDVVNEWGYSADNSWFEGYLSAIRRIRGTHPDPAKRMNPPFLGPIVIGVGNFGQDLDVLWSSDSNGNRMQQLWNADPQRNLIVSIHIYGQWCDSQDPLGGAPCSWHPQDLEPALAAVRAQADQIGYGVIIGEFGPGGGMQLDSPTNTRHLRVMQVAQEKGIGWLAWAWDDSRCGPYSYPYCGPGYPPTPCFALTKYCYQGIYNSTADLTPFGVNVIEHPTYGSIATSVKATHFP